MTVQAQHVLDEAMGLPPNERALVAEQLLAGLDSSASNSIDELWAIEAERRIDAYDRGEINTISAKKVFEKIDRQRK